MTDFTSIYDKFLSKIEDFDFVNMVEEDVNAQLHKFLLTAITEFQYVCRADLSQRSQTHFYEELEEEEKEILAQWMRVSYIETKMVVDDNMRNVLNSRDYRMYSSANLLDKMGDMNTMFRKEVQGQMSRYDYYKFKEKWKSER